MITGHGKTVAEQNEYGTFGETNGADYLVADVGLVQRFALEQFQLNLIIF